VIYFDHNATSPLLPLARDTWLEACEKFPGNPSSPHRLGSRAENALSEARQKLVNTLGCHANEIVFTSGATESNNTVLHHCARTSPAAEVWISAIEHPCVLQSAQFFFGSRLRLIPAARNGVIELEWIETELKRTRPALLAMMAANNETGTLQPWQQALDLCRSHGVPFFCDAVQWIGKLSAAELGDCDWVSGSAHKFGGPRGVGFLKVPSSLSLTPLLHGGPQEETRRAGTENVAGVLSMVAALEVREQQIARREFVAAEKRRGTFERELLGALAGSEIVGRESPRLWNTVSALMPEADCQQRWVVKLDKLGFAVSTGSACSSGKEEPSHVLRAMGYSSANAGRVLRFSAGWETSPEDWRSLLAALQTVNANAPRGNKRLEKEGALE
jgi:cysteine desulfurase